MHTLGRIKWTLDRNDGRRVCFFNECIFLSGELAVRIPYFTERSPSCCVQKGQICTKGGLRCVKKLQNKGPRSKLALALHSLPYKTDN